MPERYRSRNHQKESKHKMTFWDYLLFIGGGASIVYFLSTSEYREYSSIILGSELEIDPVPAQLYQEQFSCDDTC